GAGSQLEPEPLGEVLDRRAAPAGDFVREIMEIDGSHLAPLVLRPFNPSSVYRAGPQGSTAWCKRHGSCHRGEGLRGRTGSRGGAAKASPPPRGPRLSPLPPESGRQRGPLP